jgi:hypothetical protein
MHTKTLGHCAWEQNREQNDTQSTITRLQKENEHLKQLIILMIECMSEMELHRERHRERNNANNNTTNNNNNSEV